MPTNNFLLVILISSISSAEISTLQCMLSMTVKDYTYQSASNQVELELIFRSNCAPFPFHAFFLIPWDTWYDLNDNTYPLDVNLNIDANEFVLNFEDFDEHPFVTGYMRVYKYVKVSNVNITSYVEMDKENHFVLKNRGDFKWEKKQISKLWGIENPFPCSVSEQVLFCDIKFNKG